MLKWMAVMLLVFISISSCKKIEVEQEFTIFGEVYFDTQNTKSSLAVRTKNGNSVVWRQDGMIAAPEGERTFEFYDKSTGEVLAEKTVNVVAGNPEKWTLFQPEEGQPISIISQSENSEEPAAKDGFIKFKIANLATKSLPYENIDVVVYGKVDNGDVIELGKIEGVGKTFQETEYQEISNGKSQGVTSFYFSFIDNNTKEVIMGDGGTVFTTDVLGLPGEIIPSQLNLKNWVLTIYLLETEFPESYGICIKGTDSKWYAVNINNILFSN